MSATSGLDATPLAVAVRTGIRMLSNLASPHPDVVSGRLEHGLRAEVDRALSEERSGRGTAGAGYAAIAAVRTACAHLATRAHEDAYLALQTAQGMLPDHARRSGTPPSARPGAAT